MYFIWLHICTKILFCLFFLNKYRKILFLFYYKLHLITHCLLHRSFSNSSGMTNSGSLNSRCALISLKRPWSCYRTPPQKKISILHHKYPRSFLFYRLNQSVQSSTCHLESVWRRKILGGPLEKLHGRFSDIGVDQEFWKPEFVMPELLLKELWFINWFTRWPFKHVGNLHVCNQ